MEWERFRCKVWLRARRPMGSGGHCASHQLEIGFEIQTRNGAQTSRRDRVGDLLRDAQRRRRPSPRSLNGNTAHARRAAPMTVRSSGSRTRAPRVSGSPATRRAPPAAVANHHAPCASRSFAVCANGHPVARASWPPARCLRRIALLKARQLARRWLLAPLSSRSRRLALLAPPSTPVSPPPPCAFPRFASAPPRPRSRPSFRYVRSLFELERQRVEQASTTDLPRPNVTRFKPPARPPHTRPDPRKCRPQDRHAVRHLFRHLNARGVNSPVKLENRNDLTVCDSDSVHSSQFQTVSNTEILHQYADTLDFSTFGGAKVLVEHSETEAASELHPEPEGSYAQYHHGHKSSDAYETEDTPSHHVNIQPQEREPASEQLQHTASSDVPSTFEHVSGQLENEIHSLQPVSAQSQIKARLRNVDRKLVAPYQVAQQSHIDDDQHTEEVLDDHISDHDHHYEESVGTHFDEARTYKFGEEDHVEEEEHQQTHELDRPKQTPESPAFHRSTSVLNKVEYMNKQQKQHKTDHSDTATSLGPPPMFSYRSRRLSRNIADAMAHIWETFWKDDVRLIARIIKKRLSQLTPYFRRFIAHLVAFWGSVTYIRRALAAFIRILNRDERVRELLQRIGWASATTLKIFLSICSMLMSAVLQFYHLMRDRIIPDVHRLIPIAYYKFINSLLRLSERSPWPLVLGPFSLQFGIDNQKLPDAYLLHDKLGISRNDVTFATVNGLAHSIRQTVDMYRTRRGTHTPAEQYRANHDDDDDEDDDDDSDSEVESHDYDSESTPVHSQSTDEEPCPAPSMYSGPQYHKSSKRSKDRSRRRSLGPLTEKTNQDDSRWHQSSNKHRHTHHE